MTLSIKWRFIVLGIIISMYWTIPLLNKFLFGYEFERDTGAAVIVAMSAAIFIWSEFILWPSRARKRGQK